jgi:hypothetical protein
MDLLNPQERAALIDAARALADSDDSALVAKGTPQALTTALTTLTYTAPSTPDYALQDLTDTSGFGFASKDEGNTVLKVIVNLQTRVAELETKLKAAGLFT